MHAGATEDAKKRVVNELLPCGRLGDPINRHETELEVFGSSVELVEIDSSTVERLVAGAADADAIIATGGIRLTRPIMDRLDRCKIIALATVGVDMVDISAVARLRRVSWSYAHLTEHADLGAGSTPEQEFDHTLGW